MNIKLTLTIKNEDTGELICKLEACDVEDLQEQLRKAEGAIKKSGQDAINRIVTGV